MITANPALVSSIVAAGGLVVFPTDTVYAIGCSASNESALKRLYEVRKRPQTKPLLVHIANLAQLYTLTNEVNSLADRLINKYWPGPLTIVFKVKPDSLPALVTAGSNTIAVRWPNCQLEISLLQKTGPLVAPSANCSGDTPALSIEQAYAYFKDEVNAYLDGGICLNNAVSTIIDVSSGSAKLLRAGCIALSDEDFMLESLVSES